MILTMPPHLIQEGIRKSPLACPVALALTEAGFKNVVVSRSYITCRQGQDETIRLSMDQPLQAWTLAYDSEKEDYPLSQPNAHRIKVDLHNRTVAMLKESE